MTPHRIIVKGLLPSTSIECVLAYCNNFGSVKKAWVHHRHAGSHAFVEFLTSHGVDTILAMAPHMICHRLVTIDRVSRRIDNAPTSSSCDKLNMLCQSPSQSPFEYTIPTFFYQHYQQPPPPPEMPLPITLPTLPDLTF